MSMASPRAFGPLPVCSQARGRLAVFPAGRAKRAGKAEGKIKETGTTLAGFLKLLLSAHWLGEPQAAPRFWMSRAVISRKALDLRGFGRHHGRRTPDFSRFWPDARP